MNRKVFVGYRLVNATFSSYYVVTLVETGEQRHILADDFEAFFVDTGFVSPDAIMGGCSVDAEILSELGFEEASALCAS
ncbi:hypothetical protein [Halalkalibacter oceani]|uniref:hypothetical protein n=1 Tax=Halalkalibacter oceani TaxID=1653776 RepID=UPI0033914A89